MNNSKMIFFSVLFIVAAWNVASADQWNDYVKFMRKFYFLDNQDFDTISCKIKVPHLDEMVSNIKTQLKPLEGRIEVIETLPEFKIVLDKDGNFSLNQPYFNVSVIVEDDIKDAMRVKRGVNDLNIRVQSLTNNVVGIIEGVFENLISPKKIDYEIKEIDIIENSTKMVFNSNGIDFIRIYSGEECIETATSLFETAKSKIRFIRIDNKLLYSTSHINAKLIEKTTSVIVSVKYQKLKTIVFPGEIIGVKIFDVPGKKQSPQLKILFADCEVSLIE